MQYIMLVVLQFTDVLISIVVLFDVALTYFPILTKGHIGQLLHLPMPGTFLVGLLGFRVGTRPSFFTCLPVNGDNVNQTPCDIL